MRPAAGYVARCDMDGKIKMALSTAAEWATIVGAVVAVLTLAGIPAVRSIRNLRQNQTVGSNSTAIQSGRDSNVDTENDQAKPGSRRR
jgi:hypothetical protein